ncbi:MAG: hypothetical protein LBV67_11460 [Streptococcaceae bacterium]|jgi:hypothetical protein|nr:hypothetical protein [Streptococcaceae bacterium]
MEKRLKGGILLSVLLLFSLFSVSFYHELKNVQDTIFYVKEVQKSAKRQMMFDMAKTHDVKTGELHFEAGFVKIERNNFITTYHVKLNEDDYAVTYEKRDVAK